MLSCQKIYLLLVICTFITYTQQQTNDPAFLATFKQYLEDCGKEVGLEVDYVKGLWKANKFPNDNKLKCYYKCLNMKLGILTQSGEVVDDVLKTVAAHFIDETTDREIVAECGGIQGADLCETAFKLVACIKAAELD